MVLWIDVCILLYEFLDWCLIGWCIVLCVGGWVVEC